MLCSVQQSERAQSDKHANTRRKEIERKKMKKKQQEQEPIEIDCPNVFLCLLVKANNNIHIEQ